MIAPVGAVPLLAANNGEVSVGLLSGAIGASCYRNFFPHDTERLEKTNLEIAMSRKRNEAFSFRSAGGITW